MDKLNIYCIVQDHFGSFRSYDTKKLLWTDMFFFILVPILIGLLYFLWFPAIDDNTRRLVITSYSILIGLLLNINVLIFNRIQESKKDNLRLSLIKEMFANISFTILIALMTILLLIVSEFFVDTVERIINTLVIIFAAMFILNLLMILQRMYLLFQDEAK